MESSTLLPKIHRNSMLPPRCSRPACVNIEVKIVRPVGSCDEAVPWTPDWPSHTTLFWTKSQWSPGLVIS
jgi:hypothetical protein